MLFFVPPLTPQGVFPPLVGLQFLCLVLLLTQVHPFVSLYLPRGPRKPIVTPPYDFFFPLLPLRGHNPTFFSFFFFFLQRVFNPHPVPFFHSFSPFNLLGVFLPLPASFSLKLFPLPSPLKPSGCVSLFFPLPFHPWPAPVF